MRATKKDLRKLEKYLAGVRDIISFLSFNKEDSKLLEKQLYDAEGALRSIANAVKI